MKKIHIPPALIIYCLLSMIVFYLVFPKYNRIVFPYNLTGFIIAFSGLYLMDQTRDLFKKHQTTLKIEKSNHLITEGIFTKTRNPMYMGMFFLVLGFSIFSTSLLSLGLPFVFVLLVRLIFIRKEEQLMMETLGIISGCKKTKLFFVFDKNRARELNEVKTSKIRLAKFLKSSSLLSVNDCFVNEHNAIFGVFLQSLITSSIQ